MPIRLAVRTAVALCENGSREYRMIIINVGIFLNFDIDFFIKLFLYFYTEVMVLFIFT